MGRVAVAAASGALLAFSRPPFDVGPLACVALVPLFVLWHGRGPRASAGYAFVAGAVYYGIACSWIWYFGSVAIVPFIIGVAGYWAIAGAVIGWLRTTLRVASPWLVAAVWVLADAAVARFPVGGFSWGEIGYAFHASAPARAVASVGGVTLVTFLAVALNALIADTLVGLGRQRTWHYVRAYAGVLLVAVVVVGATVTRADPRVVDTLRIALVQGNDLNRDLTADEEDARYLPVSHFALAQDIRDPVDLIVFPESSMDEDPRTDPFVRDRLVAIARRHRAWVLANATVDAPPDGEEAENLNVLFGPDGEIVGTYAKRHLVPFGERVPYGLRDLLERWIPSLEAQVPRDMRPGGTSGRFEIAGVPTGMLICFESAFGYQVRPLVASGAQLLLVSTNNRSYRRSANSEQHLAIGRMRVAETGRPLVHASISGITAVIDPDGVVHGRTPLFQNSVLETTVAATTGETPYVRYGEWVIAASAVVVLAGIVIGIVRRRRRASVVSRQPQENVSIESRIAGYEVPEPPETPDQESQAHE